MKSTYNLEFKLFFRNSAAWIGIIVLLLTGFGSLYFGKSFIDNQQNVIKKAAVLQKKNTQINIQHFGHDTGLFFYHNKFAVANTPSAWAAFATGQRDINPYLISVSMLGLEGQLYDTDVTNPVSLLFGNMDLSFVFIFLFPLVIIAYTYNLLSEQKENGIWPLLRSQSNQSLTIIWRKFLIRILTVYTIAFLLLLAAIFYLQLPIDFALLLVTALIIFYLSFWFGVTFLFISLGKSSNYNASALVTVWVLLCILIPAALNLFLTQKFSVPEALQHVINQREGYHEKWDMDKEITMKPFFEHYPVLKKYPFPKNKTFSWFWYYGMQQMGDDKALESRVAINNKLVLRQSFTNVAALFFPTIQTQLGINELAASDLNTHLNFQQFVRQYHEQIRLHFYPDIFLNQDASETDIKKSKLKIFTPKKTVSSNGRLFSIFLITTLLFTIGVLNFKKGNGDRQVEG